MAKGFFNVFTGKREDKKPSLSSAKLDDRVRYSEELFEDYFQTAQDWRTIAKKNDEYRYNNQLENDIREQMQRLNQSPASWNLIHPNVEIAKQFLTNRDPQFQATATEDSDVQMNRAATMVMSHIWDKSDGNMQYAKNVDDYYVRGPGVLFSFVDPDADAGRGEVKIKAVDPFKVFIDPNSSDLFARDAAHIIIRDLITAEQLQENYGGVVDNIVNKATPSRDEREPMIDRRHPENPEVGQVKQSTDRDYFEVIDRYSRVIVNRFHIMEKGNGREFVLTEDQFEEYKAELAFEVLSAEGRDVVYEDSDVEDLLVIFDQTGGVFHYIQREIPTMDGGTQVIPEMAAGEPGDQAIPGSRVELVLSTKGELIDDIAIVNKTRFNRIKQTLSAGRVLVREHILEVDSYPIVPVFNNHSMNPYPLADVYFVRELQDYFNKIQSDLAAHLSNSKATRVLVPRGSNREEIETIFQGSGIAVGEYDADIGVPVQIQPVPLASEMYRMPDRIEKKVQDIFGIYGITAGDPSSLPRTFNATLLLDENAKQRMGNKIKALYGQLNVMARVVLQYAQQIYTKDKLSRVLQPNFESMPVDVPVDVFYQFRDQVIERFSDWSTAQFDIKVVSGSTLPNNRWARLEYYLKFFQMGIIDDIAVLKNSDIAELEEVISRKSQMAQAKQIIEQQEDIIKDLEGDMQTANREILHNQRKLELEKTKSKLKELEMAAEKDLQLFSERLDDSLRERQKAQKERESAMKATG